MENEDFKILDVSPSPTIFINDETCHDGHSSTCSPFYRVISLTADKRGIFTDDYVTRAWELGYGMPRFSVAINPRNVQFAMRATDGSCGIPRVIP